MTTATIATTRKNADHSSRCKDRVDCGDWERVASEVNEYGCALTPRLLDQHGVSAIRCSHARSDARAWKVCRNRQARSSVSWVETGWLGEPDAGREVHHTPLSAHPPSTCVSRSAD